MKIPKGVLVTVGVCSTALALLGLWYNLHTLLVSLSGTFSDLVERHDIPHFYTAFYTMSAICIVCYAILLFCGVQFVRSRTGVFPLFVGVLVFEVAYFFSVAMMWMVPGVGMSVGAATGVANGGLMFQAVVLFPLWAPFLAGWARKRVSHRQQHESKGEHPASETP